MRARLAQSGLVPGSTLTVSAELDEYGIPVDGRAAVTAEITDPAGSPLPVTPARGHSKL